MNDNSESLSYNTSSNSKDAILNSRIPRRGFVFFVTILDRIDPATLAARSNSRRSLTIHHLLTAYNLSSTSRPSCTCVCRTNRIEAKRSEAMRRVTRDAMRKPLRRHLTMLLKKRRGVRVVRIRAISNSSVNPRSFKREGPRQRRRRQRIVRVTQPLLRAPLDDSSRFRVNRASATVPPRLPCVRARSTSLSFPFQYFFFFSFQFQVKIKSTCPLDLDVDSR